MGMSMKVEKSSLDQVRKRFEYNKKKKEEEKKSYGTIIITFFNTIMYYFSIDFQERMKELKEEVWNAKCADQHYFGVEIMCMVIGYL